MRAPCRINVDWCDSRRGDRRTHGHHRSSSRRRHRWRHSSRTQPEPPSSTSAPLCSDDRPACSRCGTSESDLRQGWHAHMPPLTLNGSHQPRSSASRIHSPPHSPAVRVGHRLRVEPEVRPSTTRRPHEVRCRFRELQKRQLCRLTVKAACTKDDQQVPRAVVAAPAEVPQPTAAREFTIESAGTSAFAQPEIAVCEQAMAAVDHPKSEFQLLETEEQLPVEHPDRPDHTHPVTGKVTATDRRDRHGAGEFLIGNLDQTPQALVKPRSDQADTADHNTQPNQLLAKSHELLDIPWFHGWVVVVERE